jgi:hypothetical protein
VRLTQARTDLLSLEARSSDSLHLGIRLQFFVVVGIFFGHAVNHARTIGYPLIKLVLTPTDAMVGDADRRREIIFRVTSLTFDLLLAQACLLFRGPTAQNIRHVVLHGLCGLTPVHGNHGEEYFRNTCEIRTAVTI